MKETDSIEEVASIRTQELSWGAEDRALRTSLIHRVPGCWSQLNSSQHTHTTVEFKLSSAPIPHVGLRYNF